LRYVVNPAIALMAEVRLRLDVSAEIAPPNIAEVAYRPNTE
jgi:hypothetical protein